MAVLALTAAGLTHAVTTGARAQVPAQVPVQALAADVRSPDDTARYLGGLKPSAGSREAAFASDPAWLQHANAFDQAFGRFERAQLARIRSWRQQNLTSHRPTLLYFFSGPDFLYADAFFPDAQTYVLSGLEPIGPVPQITAANRGALPALRASLSSVLNLSFFRTREMRLRLGGGQFAGTLPLLYIFLARAGKTVQSTSLIRLDADGIAGPAEGVAVRGEVNGVKIVFTDALPAAGAPSAVQPATSGATAAEPAPGAATVDGRASVAPAEPSAAATRTLYYFQGDVSNAGPGFEALAAFCRALGPADGFVKSASYLMHSGTFSKVRDFLVAQTELMLEDDSGIPVQFFTPSEWALSPYGRYLGPIALFPGRRQRQLDELYARGPQRPIEFGIGYRYRQNESNLLLAVKRPR